MKGKLIGKSLDELKKIVADYGMPGFTAKQIAQWLYVKRVTSIDDMTNISKKHRDLLSEDFVIGLDLPRHEAISVDGTKKYLFSAAGDKFIEAVYIPDKERATLCVSSQVGCKMNCVFCMTGKQGFNGNLTSAEIINQIVSIPDSEKLTNLVFMGMGEPMDNYEEVLKALEILTSDWGFSWSPKRITVSTIGVEKNVRRFLDESKCHLAVSLHASFPEKRLEIMPVEKAWNMYDIIDLLKEYDFSKQRRLSFEYIMFNGYNDSIEDAKELAKVLKGLDYRVNLIRFHAIPDVDLKSSDEKAMIAFRDYLTSKGVTCTIRSSRGEDIFAACGMLSTKKGEKNDKQG